MWTLDKALGDEDIVLIYRRPPEMSIADFASRIFGGLKEIGIDCIIGIDPVIDKAVNEPIDDVEYPDPKLN